jgi:hypothetical protein
LQHLSVPPPHSIQRSDFLLFVYSGKKHVST